MLFKVNEGGPGADLRYLGTDPNPYRKTFELHAGKEADAFACLAQFMRGVSSPAQTELELSRDMDIGAFIKTTAVMLFAGAFDQYTGWGPHNYYLYRNPADQRWTYIPWDLDVGFADHAFGMIPVLDGWHAAWPAPVPGRPLMEQLISHTNLLQQYRKEAMSILQSSFRPEILVPKLRTLYAQIKPALDEDPFPPRRVTVPSDSGYDDILASMERFIRQRYALARSQLERPGDRPRPAAMKPPGPRPPLLLPSKELPEEARPR